MPAALLPAPVARPAVFPSPAVPAHFADGDRYEWPHTGAVWVRTRGGDWVPSPDDGSGYLTDAEVGTSLRTAVAQQEVDRVVFTPVTPNAHQYLPGRYYYNAKQLVSLLADSSPYRFAMQYVYSHDRACFVPLRDLVAEHDEDLAHGVARTVMSLDMLDLLTAILADQEGPEVSYDSRTSRAYVRYACVDPEWQGEGPQPRVTCLHVFLMRARRQA
ncbi:MULTISPECIES: hypothetical protein [unclassified Streptomyces]|uniref:hypothetical protein n=1 Tax=unclassified Streptomyces TaxID=2593676 RepID=UPI0035E165AC